MPPLNKPHLSLLIAHWVQLAQPICAWYMTVPWNVTNLPQVTSLKTSDSSTHIRHQLPITYRLQVEVSWAPSPSMLECWLVKPYSDNHRDYGFMRTITLRCPADTVSQHSSLSSASNSCPIPSSVVFQEHWERVWHRCHSFSALWPIRHPRIYQLYLKYSVS